ncbi:hypothetical protein [Streptomyces sp. NPDC018352]|uniref:hypothetical protein n=1 Tax=Streptomyces sp. NPDC018352 TaxID=3157194 RepID=UPI00340557D2
MSESDDTPVAVREWHTRARVRILADYDAGAVDPPVRRRFCAGEELVLIRWGRAGRPVRADEAWWTSADIDGAHIVPAEHVEVLDVLDEVSPFGS